ncbi:GYD domain-containing protein [Caldilinea sp.]|uniref:GYD domain-containing protein n=1 Tax=Caldilinea sp. TaxID=2293560 RepID=UPI002C5A8610|nr:GYD domain-containing protein [Anaerolineales bacterium]HQY91161.1 GYD domain-containing protein [Caldilinea sp.]HRA64712.1 GYD domain-containing protein [Caldilinea sp.]
MAKYLIQASYVGEGVKGLLKDGGSVRRAAVEKLAKSVGGAVEVFYYAFGESDLYIIGDFPDNAAVAAVALTVNASGTATCKTTVLLTPEEIDAAAKKTPSYIPPGQ